MYISVCSTYMYINVHTHMYMCVDIVSGKRNLEEKVLGKLLGQTIGLFHFIFIDKLNSKETRTNFTLIII